MKTLAQLNEEVWKEYEKTKKPACQYLTRNGYTIVQCELDGCNGTTYVHFGQDLHPDIVINWQALGNTIYVIKVTDKIISFLFDEIYLDDENPFLAEMCYIRGADGTDDELDHFLKEVNYRNHEKLLRRIYPDCDEDDVHSFMYN